MRWADERQTGRLGLERFRHVVNGSVAPRCPPAELTRAFKYAALLEPQHGMAVALDTLAHVAASLEVIYAADSPVPPREGASDPDAEPIVHIPLLGVLDAERGPGPKADGSDGSDALAK
jgi:hypothetical protein